MTLGEAGIATKPTRRIVLGFVLLFGFCARAATYKAPLLDHHGWRQADTASIARNFYREGMNVLYPQIDQRGGRQVGYVETPWSCLPSWSRCWRSRSALRQRSDGF
jgi:hypothetical protein